MPVREADYARLSKDRRGLSENVEIQLEECADTREEAPEDIALAGCFSDNDISASRFTTKPRPGYEDLLTLMRGNGVDRLRVTELSRLYRRPRDLEDLIDLSDATTFRAITTTSGAYYDLRTASGRAALRDYAKNNALESDNISERARRKKRAQAKQGLPNGGRRAYGYAKDQMTIVPEEAEVIREAAKRVLAGESIRAIFGDLNARDIPTAEHKKWYKPTLVNMLSRKRYVGIREHKGAEYKAAWPPILDAETFERLQVALRANEHMAAQRGNPRKYLLAGYVYCGGCGRKLSGLVKRDRATAPKRARYLCRVHDAQGQKTTCPYKVSQNAEPLEDLIVEAVLYRLDSDLFAKIFGETQAGSADLKAALDEHAARKQRLDELITTYYGDNPDGLTRAHFMVAKDAAEASLAKAAAEVERLSSRRASGLIPIGQTIRQAWEKSTDLGWQRQILGLLIDKIVVNPGGGKPLYKGKWKFDPERIEVVWKC